MDKISKRSKGYAFIEYTTEEAAAAALNEMNGKARTFPFILYRLLQIQSNTDHILLYLCLSVLETNTSHRETKSYSTFVSVAYRSLMAG